MNRLKIPGDERMPPLKISTFIDASVGTGDRQPVILLSVGRVKLKALLNQCFAFQVIGAMACFAVQ